MAKKRKGQGAIEFGIVIPIVLLMILGMFDLFNISITYMQMAYFSQEIVDKAMMQPGTDKNNLVKRSSIKPFFFFGKEEMKISTLYPQNQSHKTGVGTVWCATVERKTNLLMGKALAGGDNITIKKEVCSIQESSNK